MFVCVRKRERERGRDYTLIWTTRASKKVCLLVEQGMNEQICVCVLGIAKCPRSGGKARSRYVPRNGLVVQSFCFLTHTHKQAGKQANRQTNRHRERERERRTKIDTITSQFVAVVRQEPTILIIIRTGETPVIYSHNT